VNSVVGGAALAIACWVGFEAAAVIGLIFVVLSVGVHLRWSRRRLETGVPTEVLFQSPHVG
jgi:membrane protein implicated in regulation of membrane protease activity